MALSRCFVAVTSSLALLFACAGSLLAEEPGSAFRQARFQVKKTPDVVYGQGTVQTPQPGNKDLLLDVYEPQGENLPQLRPAMVVIHGGGFRSGSRGAANMAGLCQELAARGFVCVSIDYRMQGDDPDTEGRSAMERAMRAAVIDAGVAVQWLASHADEYHIDKQRIAIGGGSAGAITSLLLTYAKESRTKRPHIAAVIDLWGSLYRSSGDIEAGDPPVLIIHGVKDNVVPYSGAEAIVKQAKAVGVASELYAIADGGHGVPLSKVVDGVTLTQRIVNFLDTQLKLEELDR